MAEGEGESGSKRGRERTIKVKLWGVKRGSKKETREEDK